MPIEHLKSDIFYHSFRLWWSMACLEHQSIEHSAHGFQSEHRIGYSQDTHWIYPYLNRDTQRSLEAQEDRDYCLPELSRRACLYMTKIYHCLTAHQHIPELPLLSVLSSEARQSENAYTPMLSLQAHTGSRLPSMSSDTCCRMGILCLSILQ